MPNKLLAFALAAVLVLSGAADAAAASSKLASVERPTRVSVHDGRVVWSAYRSGAQAFVLMQRSNGRTRRVPGVRSRSVAFDVDLGPGPNGAAAVYSRCRREPLSSADALPDYGGGRACRLWRYDFRSRRERRVSVPERRDDSLSTPTIWRSRMAYVLTNPRDDIDFAQVLVTSGRRIVRLRGGPRSPSRRPGSLDLRGSQIIYSSEGVVSACPDEAAQRGGETAQAVSLWLASASTRRQRELATGCEGTGPSTILGPSLIGRSQAAFFASRADKEPAQVFGALDLRTAAARDLAPAPPTTVSAAIDRSLAVAVVRIAPQRYDLRLMPLRVD